MAVGGGHCLKERGIILRRRRPAYASNLVREAFWRRKTQSIQMIKESPARVCKMGQDASGFNILSNTFLLKLTCSSAPHVPV